ncbi:MULTISPECIES: helix-turn-helix domain-containing protein [Streptomycetaceae]|uniref:TlmR2 n=1 Tax=Streptantibioticus cattleyicolor (strain ATCC 35852 / DSM 46488 / JCM 4925 / NBRC 14057 / NRRL 8057) TaxID=1003195 RepID=F8JW10_STREN|nr:MULTISPECIES: helix-turn-helix domain-containing protein [Streptomycetaceae]AEW92902.1 TlmR2 [Streptantibioticus cattleyicolor NRRL 8057 = DSM 46488]MYS57653.1 helix-turn-helix domain-containing protein [Streptomyces sp. SID5468]CCB73259.1 TlmR2 [Streptantibioticus cattleyicolor NRRL 8057 = DSM 46488]
MPESPEEHIGARIASYRKLAGYTQRELAEAAFISLGWVRKVERGERVPSHGFLTAAARTLHVSVEELTGQPYRGESRSDQRVHAPIPGIRAAVRHYDLPADWYPQPKPLRDLERDVRTAGDYRAAARYSRLGQMLPKLLEELTAAVHLSAEQERRRAAGLLASAYYMAHSLTMRLGYPDLIGQLEDRMQWAADLSGDPLMRALAGWTRSYSFDAFGDYSGGLKVLASAREELESDDSVRNVDQVVMVGSLHLRESSLAAFAEDADATAHHLEKATYWAKKMPRGTDELHYHMTFGPSNVGVHEVAAAVELKRPDEAVRVAKKLNFPADMARTRQGHHYVAVARAYLSLDNKDKALKYLQDARRVAPEQTKYHPIARETARVLTHKYRRTTEELRSISSWLGVKS